MGKIALLVTLFLLEANALASDCAVFLIPGAFAQDSERRGAGLFISHDDYFREYISFFEEHGCRVRKGIFPPDATIEERGLVLKDQVERFKKEVSAPIVLVAHSQGGLDARYALRTLKLTGVSHLASVGVPHSGTRLADWAVEQRDERTLIYWLLRLIADYDLDALRFVAEFRESFLRKHADAFAPVASVRYGAARGICRTKCHIGLRLLQWWVGIDGGDGISTGAQQRFGEDLGQYDLDHLSEINADEAKRGERKRLLESVWYFIGSTKN